MEYYIAARFPALCFPMTAVFSPSGRDWKTCWTCAWRMGGAGHRAWRASCRLSQPLMSREAADYLVQARFAHLRQSFGYGAPAEFACMFFFPALSLLRHF